VSENGGHVSWRFQTNSLKVAVMGDVTRPQKAENASCITNSLSIGNRSGDSRCGL
jgi:hypothetical protein